jgi:cyclophilin family peptidyl-prolyl cis-trans isomerase/HEAT repeat protein
MLSSRLLMTASSIAVRPTPRQSENEAGGRGRRALLSAFAIITACSLPLGGCKTTTASTPVVVTPVPPVVIPAIPWQQKIGWIVRLEDQRLLRDPNPPKPAVLREATPTAAAVFALEPPSDLVKLVDDDDAGVRARAALAIGRVGLPEGLPALARALSEPDEQVRQSAAFAMGLIGDAEARPALRKALDDASPLVQGRAAEALGLIGDRADAEPVAVLVQRLVRDGSMAALSPDDVTHPQAPAVEAARLGIYALTRLGSYEALASAVLDGKGQPLTRWWPVAYALQRIGDTRANAPLLALLSTPGRYTAAFAARGLSRMPSAEAVTALRQIVERRQAPTAVVVQAIRSLGTSGDAASLPVLLRLIGDASVDGVLRDEAMTAYGTLARREQVDVLLELLTHRSPSMRAAAVRALARVDADVFLSVVASLDQDDDWTVRTALAQALGSIPRGRGEPRLRTMLADEDVRVVPAVLAALAATNAPGVDRFALERLNDRDFVIRGAAATALADVKAVAAVPSIVAAYHAASADNEYGARAAMLAAIARLDAAAARPLLEAALADRDWAVRVRAATLLREQKAFTAQTAMAMRPATAGRDVESADWQRVVAPPFAPLAYVETSRGTIEIQLAVTDAPMTVDNFVTLARRGFFNGRRIHRVVPDFVMQDGDPRGDGEGGPGYTIRDELNARPYLRGTVGMALDWKDTGGSQFFITHSPQPHLDARYTVFGTVVSGMEVVDQLTTSDVIQRVRIWDGITQP